MFGRPVCFRSRTDRCYREAEYEAARAGISSGIALEAVRLWDTVQSQWRVGMAGAYGLDYVAAERVAAAIGVEWDGRMLDLMQALETEQLEEWDRARELRKAAGSG